MRVAIEGLSDIPVQATPNGEHGEYRLTEPERQKQHGETQKEQRT